MVSRRRANAWCVEYSYSFYSFQVMSDGEKKGREREKEERKKERKKEEERRRTKSKFSRLFFSAFEWVSKTVGTFFRMEQ